jgi:hypothetical protein
VKNLIPHFIQEQYLKQRHWHGHLKGYTLFVDLSGFTPLTEALMKQGTKGAEQLSNILNEIFQPLVRIWYTPKEASSRILQAMHLPLSFPRSIEGINGSPCGACGYAGSGKCSACESSGLVNLPLE